MRNKLKESTIKGYILGKQGTHCRAPHLVYPLFCA